MNTTNSEKKKAQNWQLINLYISSWSVWWEKITNHYCFVVLDYVQILDLVVKFFDLCSAEDKCYNFKIRQYYGNRWDLKWAAIKLTSSIERLHVSSLANFSGSLIRITTFLNMQSQCIKASYGHLLQWELYGSSTGFISV